MSNIANTIVNSQPRISLKQTSHHDDMLKFSKSPPKSLIKSSTLFHKQPVLISTLIQISVGKH